MQNWGITKLKAPMGRVAYVRTDKVTIELACESQAAAVVVKTSFLAEDGSVVLTGEYYGGAGVSKEFAKVVTELVQKAAQEVAEHTLGLANTDTPAPAPEGSKEPFPQSI